jgi:hypothetical protein
VRVGHTDVVVAVHATDVDGLAQIEPIDLKNVVAAAERQVQPGNMVESLGIGLSINGGIINRLHANAISATLDDANLIGFVIPNKMENPINHRNGNVSGWDGAGFKSFEGRDKSAKGAFLAGQRHG